MRIERDYVSTLERRAMSSRSRLSTVIGVVTATLVLSVGGPSQAAEIGTVLNATSDASGNLIDITYSVDGNPETLLAEDLIGSTLVLSTLTANPTPGGDANRFWTLDGAPQPTEAEALRSVGDKYMGTALQDCVSTSAHDTLFDQPIIPGPGPEIFFYHGGHNDPFVVLDENGSPALTIPNATGDAISVALSTQFRAWYLRDNVNYQVEGTFPHFDTQDRIVALDLDPSDVVAIGGLRFGGGPCDYVYEILGRQPPVTPTAVFTASDTVAATSSGASSTDSIWVDVDRDGDLDIVNALGTLDWRENVGGDPRNWPSRTIDPADALRNYISHGDLDGDGDPDILSAEAFGGPYYWYENDGVSPPGWARQTLSASSSDAQFVEPVDLDADGDLDVVIADNLAWLENDGAADPSWTLRVLGTSLNVGASFGDFDRDGDVDVLAPTQGCAADVELFESDGGSPPTFTPRVVGNLDGAFLVATGDIDGDGDLDFTVPGSSCVNPSSSELVWFESDGAAVPTFTRRIVETGFVHGRVALRDINLDGDLDIVTNVAIAGEAGRYYSNDGGSPPKWVGRLIPGQAGISSFRTDIGDFDQDGDIDLLTATAEDGVVLLTENRTIHRSAVFPTKSVITNTLNRAIGVFAADVDGDGDIDALSASTADDTIAWYENDGAMPPSWTRRDITNTADGTLSVFAADVDGDGDMDALSASFNDDTIAWYENDGAVPPNWTKRIITATAIEARTVIAADVDGDGEVDAVSSSEGDDTIAWYENDGASPPGWTKKIITDTADSAVSVFAKDVDGDGDLDVLSASQLDDTIAWYENGASTVDVVNPDFELLYKAGSTTVTSPLFPNFTTAFGPTHLGMPGPTVTFSDGSVGNSFDMAGWQWDTTAAAPAVLAVSNVNSAFIAGHKRDMVLLTNGFLFGGGTAARTASQVLAESLQQNVLYTLTADFGWRTDNAAPTLPPILELYAGATLLTPTASSSPALIQGQWVTHSRTYLVSNPAISGPLKIEIGLGANTDGRQLNIDRVSLTRGAPWTKRIITDTTDNAFYVSAADIDGDGDIDALSASQPEDLIAWYENDGASPPSWTKRTISNTADGAIAVLPADLDADGDVDALAASNLDDTIAWYENNGASPPAWTRHTITDTAVRARTVFAADVDGDGDLDALSASDTDGTIAWYENKGGQFNNTAVECGTGNLSEGEERLLASTTVRLNGRPGDSPGRVNGVSFNLGVAPSDLKNLIETLRLYRDDGSGAFEPGEDVLLDTVDVATFLRGGGGDYWLPLPDDDPDGIVAAPATFFLIGQVSPNAAAEGVPLLVSNRTGSTFLIDANAGVSLIEENDGLDVSCSEVRPIVRTIVVNDTGDAVDATPGDGICATAGGACALRAAISEANSTPGPDRIALPAGTYQVSLAGSFEDLNATGDLDITGDLEITGAGAGLTIIDGGALDRVLNTHGAITVVIRDLTLRNGNTGGRGGSLHVEGAGTVELRGCVVEANSATADGGGIAADAGSLVEVVESRIVGNNAAGAVGGGISSRGTVKVVWSEISGNIAGAGGGGLYSDTSGVMQVLSSTISGNNGGLGGGGIYGEGPASVAVDNSTVAGNNAGGVFSATFNSNSTIIADNLPEDCSGTMLSAGHTLVGDTSGCTITSLGPGDQLDVDPLLGPLGDYGGTTLTHRLQSGSPAIDAGSCGGIASDRDQTGQPRPVDDLDTANVADGCDIGAYEARLGQTQPPIEIPIRWCGVRGAPSVQDPSLVGQNTVNDVLRSRHEAASDEIYLPQAGIVLRSAGNFIIEDYPILDAPACVETSPDVFTCDDAREAGDVVLNLATGDFSEFHDLVAACRVAWEALDPNIGGITAVHINSFIDPAGGLLDIIGVGGRAPFGDAVEQSVAGRVMVVDNFYRLAANPADTNDRLFGHEIGHALSLLHGNGLDDDLDQLLDNNDELGAPRFDGPNLLQYRDGDTLTPLQALQMRIHALVAIPGAGLAQFTSTVAAGTPIDEETDEILQWGFRELLELEQDEILQFEQDEILQFEQDEILQWEEDEILQWEEDEILQWEQDEILQFGATFDGSAPTDTTTFHISLAELPWPASVRPDTRFYFYLNLDTNDSTGAYPAFFPIPGDSPNNFPGLNNLEGEPPIGDELGVDVILEVTLTSDCPGGVCSSFANLRAFDFNDTLQTYESILTQLQLDLTAYGLGLYRDNGGVEPDVDDVPVGITIRVTVPNSVLFAAGWGFQAGPNGPVPNRIGMEAASTVECSGGVLNTDPLSVNADCSCATCNECGPDYPGCGPDDPDPKQPRILSGSRIVVDHDAGLLTFEPPILPRAVVAPALAEEGQTVTVYVFDLPTDVTGQVEVSLGGVVLATVPTNAIDAGGEVSLTVPLPAGVVGEQTLSSGITGFAPRATTRVTITPSLAFPDNDGDGIDDASDPDDDNDGVIDGNDSDPLNPFVCADSDFDTCDDCNSGSLAPLDDGPDFDLDGQCNAGDPDDDNDGVLDGLDGEPLNPNACGDLDNDLCDDCAVVSNIPSPSNDGPDLDGDGVCDLGDENPTTPVVGAIVGPPVDPSPVGTTITASASFTDGDVLDTHTAEWDWGDGTITIGTVTENGGAGVVEDDHTYTVPGVYRIRLTVSDGLDSGASTHQFVVIFDPTGGFVTGGGWIDSPAGAYAPNPALIGQADFGFVSKYKKGANIPTGNTEFEFAVADLLFKSTEYDWLVIAGHKAQFKGTGTINGLGNYGFLLSAIDEKLTPSTDVDLFRIKIWDKNAADAVVYDNQMGGPDDADPTTALGGGSIVIHKK